MELMAASVLGFLAGLGVGGGSLLVLYLTLILGWSPEEARAVNLLFFLPGAAIATFLRRRDGSLELKTLMGAILAGCIAAGAASLLSKGMDVSLLKRLFGGLLIVTGLRELTYKGKSGS